jgi:hypothetical protein
MLRTKIHEVGKLQLLEDGGLVCSVSSNQPPLLEKYAREVSLLWESPDQSELAIGDLVAHSERGVARYRGRQSINNGKGNEDHLKLEFADGALLFVPDNRSDLVQKLGSADCAPIRLSVLGIRGGQWPHSYCVELLPNAYCWPGVGTLPELPQERSREVMGEWRRACATYQKTLHANANYRQAAQEYFERQNHEPQPWLGWWVYRGMVLRVGSIGSVGIRDRDEHLLLIKQYVLRRERKVEKIRREVETLKSCGSLGGREPIPEQVRLFVWRRDQGQCVRCASRERLEFDHIIPVTAGGSNTERNIQLLCESCNRSKGATV